MSSPTHSTLQSTLSREGSDVVLIKTPQPRPRDAEDSTSFLLTGALQMLLGVLMAVFGTLSLVHGASMASAGGGLWGGAVVMITGLAGFIAGLRTGALVLTATLALNLVSLAVSNVVVVLAVTGLIRDGQHAQVNTPEDEDPNWAPLLANCGLLIVATCECLAVLVTAYRCYQLLCPCKRRPAPQREEATTGETPEPAYKQQLIANWLGHSGQPRGVLLVPQAAMQGHFSPIYALPSPPVSSRGISSVCSHYPQYPLVHRRYAPSPVYMPAHRRRRANHMPVHAKRERRHRHRLHRDRSVAEQERKPRQEPRPITEEDVAKTYTGMDRKVAEEFIQIAMEPSISQRSSSTSASSSDTTQETDGSVKYIDVSISSQEI